MTFSDYQKDSRATAIYPRDERPYVYPTLGLTSEAGEVASKIKKAIRDEAGVISPERLSVLRDELGDVLWYVAQLATELGLSLDDVAGRNLEKLASRKERHQLSGDGDNR